MDVFKLLTENSQRYPHKPAFIFKDTPLTFKELKDKVFNLAVGLLNLGLKKGDKLVIYLPNGPAYIFSYLAGWLLGITVVPLDFMLTETEITYFINHSEANFLISQPKKGVSLEALRKNCPTLREIILTQEQEGHLFLDTLLQGPVSYLSKAKIKESDYAIIFYTSGTTGSPKGVLVNYRQLTAPSKALEYFVDLSAKDIVLCAVPFSHLGGLIYIQTMLWFGLSVVLMERFVPLEFLKSIPKYKITSFWIVPSMYYAFLQLKEFEELDFSSLRWIVSFGASSSPDALRRFHRYCPQAYFLNGWGLTETNAPTTVLRLGSDKIESVGRPAPWIEVKIVDEEGKEVKKGQSGEIIVKGWVVSDGYYKNPQANQDAFKDGWFYTGDIGKFDEEGDLYIVGRKKEMIKVGGEIVFEPEIEAAILKYPEVTEVAVIGVADNLRGEVPKAFVVLKEGVSLNEDILRQFCREHLAHFKIPHYFEFVRELPKNRTGKVDKIKLKSQEGQTRTHSRI